MLQVHRIRLVPTPEQEVSLRKACGVARFAYNWGLCEWQRAYEAGELRIGYTSLARKLNAIKYLEFPWMLEVSHTVTKQALKNLDVAYQNFYSDIRKYKAGLLSWKRVRRPRLKKKGSRDSFRADNGTWNGHENAVRVACRLVTLPRIGSVKMRETLRFDGAIKSAIVSQVADRWFVSLAVEGPDPIRICRFGAPIGGVDIGLVHLATVNDGAVVDFSASFKRGLQRIRLLSRRLTRKAYGSENFAKAKTKLAKLHARVADIRSDTLHKLTTDLVRRFGIIGIEDLNVEGMQKMRPLARRVGETGFAEFRRQLEYKGKRYGAAIVIVDRYFPSSKTCSRCCIAVGNLKISDRQWSCPECGSLHDRDVNAAINLARFAESSAVKVCGAGGSGVARKRRAKRSAKKQKRRREASRTAVAQLVPSRMTH